MALRPKITKSGFGRQVSTRDFPFLYLLAVAGFWFGFQYPDRGGVVHRRGDGSIPLLAKR